MTGRRSYRTQLRHELPVTDTVIDKVLSASWGPTSYLVRRLVSQYPSTIDSKFRRFFQLQKLERRRGDRILLIILVPNEIYFCIFKHTAPPTGRPTSEQLELGIFTNLSRVCRFFANFCIPRMFEFVKLPGSIFPDDTPTGLRHDPVYKTSRESTLCTQIAAKRLSHLPLPKQ